MPSESQKHSLDEATRERIEEALKNWGKADSPAFREVQEAVRKWDGLAQPLMDAISASERLSEDDFAVRINT